MSQVVAGGFNSLLTLLKSAGPQDAAQLDALAAAAVYLQTKSPEERRYSLNYLDSFAGELHGRDLHPYASSIARWQVDPSLAQLHPLLTGLATLAGTPTDKLAGYWDKLGPHQFAPPAPFALRASYPTGFGPGWSDVKPSELTAPDGTHYCAFFANGLETAATVYIGVDHDKDGVYEEVLPTSLLHYFKEDIDFTGGDTPAIKQDDFHLDQIDGDALTLTYQTIGLPPGFAGTPAPLPATATLHLADLRRDTDGDGLSDVAEQLLYLDPAKADTDGDGVADLNDPTPNVDAAKMGRDERAVARAMQYFFAWDEGQHTGWWGDASYRSSGNPWQARYFTVSGAGPVAFTMDSHTWGICRVAPDPLEKWKEYPPTFVAGDTGVSVSLGGGLFGLPGAGTLGATVLGQPGPGGDSVVSINFHGVGYAVEMKEVNGELYPVRAYMTWIS